MATVTDNEVIAAIHQQLAARNLLPQTHIVDTGYLDARGLVSAATTHQIDLLGPVHADTTWQARQGRGFAAAEFDIQWAAQRVMCPQGHQSAYWQARRDHTGHDIVDVGWSWKTCKVCPVLSQCTQKRRTNTEARQRSGTFCLTSGAPAANNGHVSGPIHAPRGHRGHLSPDDPHEWPPSGPLHWAGENTRPTGLHGSGTQCGASDQLVGAKAETQTAPVSVCDLGSTYLIIRQHDHVGNARRGMGKPAANRSPKAPESLDVRKPYTSAPSSIIMLSKEISVCEQPLNGYDGRCSYY